MTGSHDFEKQVVNSGPCVFKLGHYDLVLGSSSTHTLYYTVKHSLLIIIITCSHHDDKVNHDDKVCKVTDLPTPIWGWVEKADFSHNFTGAHGQLFDVWVYKTAGVTFEEGVPSERPDELYYFTRDSAFDHFSLYVQQWSTAKPHPTWFEVPRECPSKAAASTSRGALVFN